MIVAAHPTDADQPVHDPIDHNLKKKKKKRHREEDDQPHEKKKKKHKKRHGVPEQDLEAVLQAQAVTEPEQPALLEPQKKKKKKKEKKDKPIAQPASQVAPLPAEDTNPSANAQSSASAAAAAFFSAIVAAATGAPDAGPAAQVPLSPNQPPFIPHMLSPQQQFMPYPFLPYGFGAPPFTPQSTVHPMNLLPAPAPPFPDLPFGSNEDVLRALQSLDISKITNAIKSLGDVSGMQSEEHPTVLPMNQVPLPPNVIMNHLGAKKSTNTNGHRRTIDMSLPGPEQHVDPDHAHLLANKWLNTAKLAELVKMEGLVYRKGKFSAIEEQQLRSAIESYQHSKQLSDEQMLEVIFPKNEKNKDNTFWSEITSAVPQRPITAVYHHVRRTYHPMKQQGKWMPEEDALLKQAVVDLGQQWEKVSERVGRMSSDCRDRYRNHIDNRDIRVTGPWTKEEEEQLTRIVTEMTVKQGKDIDNDVFWGRVSELMGGRRGRQQCRIKWTDALSKTIKNEGRKPRWSQQDAYILVHKIDSLNVRDDTEIDWKTIPDLQWNLWSAHTLQRRWLTMKRSIKGHEDMTHQEIMDILRVKKAQLPVPPPARKRKERRVISAENISDAD